MSVKGQKFLGGCPIRQSGKCRQSLIDIFTLLIYRLAQDAHLDPFRFSKALQREQPNVRTRIDDDGAVVDGKAVSKVRTPHENLLEDHGGTRISALQHAAMGTYHTYDQLRTKGTAAVVGTLVPNSSSQKSVLCRYKLVHSGVFHQSIWTSI